MKKPITILSFALLASVSACNSNSGNKEAELERLKKEQAEIEGKIAQLEGEVKTSGKGGQLDQKPVPVNVLTVKRSEEHTSELQSQSNLVCRLLLEKKNDRISSKPMILLYICI